MGGPKKKTSKPTSMGIGLNDISNQIVEKAQKIEQTHNKIIGSPQIDIKNKFEKEVKTNNQVTEKRKVGRPKSINSESFINTSISLRESEDEILQKKVGELIMNGMARHRPKPIDLIRIMIKKLDQLSVNELKNLFIEYKNS